jgi:hypothetical protein
LFKKQKLVRLMRAKPKWLRGCETCDLVSHYAENVTYYMPGGVL